MMECRNMTENIEIPGEIVGVGVDFFGRALFTAETYKF